MIKFFIKIFIKNYENITDNNVREKYGRLSGVFGIILNLLLFSVKGFAGIMSGSIGVISDAFNNLSDMGSSVVALVGTRLSNAKADKEHPFGHGRAEYISSLIVSFIILLVGFELLKSSVMKIISPKEIIINGYLIPVLIISVIIKLWMFSYNRYMGKKINSTVLYATSIDSRNDAIATSAVLIAAYLQSFTSFPLDAAAGCGVSALIMYSGYGVAKDTIGALLGSQPDEELVETLEKYILSAPEIAGIHDLIVHDYGPGRIMASVHAEVDADCDIMRIHDVIDHAENIIEKETGVHIVIHMDPVISNCEETNSVKEYVNNYLAEINNKLSIHDFRMVREDEKINVIFDLCVPVDINSSKRTEIIDKINTKLKERDERYNTVIRIDNLY